ncbi:MAG: hypothetical protein EA369_01570 [Bradymonadales bacterium]|nr:MAG: hypothetical protein EA369_01570 [Bradymonadales bacterium]
MSAEEASEITKRTNEAAKFQAKKIIRMPHAIKNLKTHVIQDFGFKVVLVDPPMREFEGEKILDIDMQKLSELVMDLLLVSPERLTGSQARFIRKKLRVTQEQMASDLGRSQPNIAADEAKGNEPAFDQDTTQLAVKLYFLKKRRSQLIHDHKHAKILDLPLEDLILPASEYRDPRSSFVVEKEALAQAS